MFKSRKKLTQLQKIVEKSIDKLREPPVNQEPLAVADYLESALKNSE